MDYEAVVMGGSAGGLRAFGAILAALDADFPLPVLLVQHLHSEDAGGFARHLGRVARLPVIEPCDKERILGSRVYVAPAGYHMLVERGGSIALSTGEKVNWSRPSIDVLFQSAAAAWGGRVLAVILSGASRDGAEGIRSVSLAGGRTIAQDPASAEQRLMPGAAIATGRVDEVLGVDDIVRRLVALRPVPGAFQRGVEELRQ